MKLEEASNKPTLSYKLKAGRTSLSPSHQTHKQELVALWSHSLLPVRASPGSRSVSPRLVFLRTTLQSFAAQALEAAGWEASSLHHCPHTKVIPHCFSSYVFVIRWYERHGIEHNGPKAPCGEKLLFPLALGAVGGANDRFSKRKLFIIIIYYF